LVLCIPIFYHQFISFKEAGLLYSGLMLYTICSHIGHAAAALVRPGNERMSFLGCTHVGRAPVHAGRSRLAVHASAGSYALIEAIKTAIDDYAERETGNREFFWNRQRKAG
jgi:hypothetical protein